MTRDYPKRPYVGVGVVVWKGDHVLLVKRGKAPRKGEWSLPGGGQELGETVREAAHREVLEETDVHVDIVGLIDVVDAIRRDDSEAIEHHYTLVDFAAQWVSGDPKAADDAVDVKWVPYTDVKSYVSWDETIRIVEQSAFLVGHTAPTD